MPRLISATLLSVLFLSIPGTTASAQFNYDIANPQQDLWESYNPFPFTIVPEYEVWATNPKPLWVWDLVLVYEDGSEEVFGSYLSENDASRWLLLAFDYELFDVDALVSSRVERRNGRKPRLMDTFDSLEDARAVFLWYDAFGWNPSILVRYRVVRRW